LYFYCKLSNNKGSPVTQWSLTVTWVTGDPNLFKRTISGTTWNFFTCYGSLESSRQMEKDGVFRNFLSAIFPTWRTPKPEIDGAGEQVELSSKFQRLPPHFPPWPSSWSYCRHRPTWSTTLYQHGGPLVDSKPEVDCISETGRAIDAIPTATPTFSTKPYSPKSLATSCDFSYYHILTWRTLNRK
jgi:hypothetical protein